jgi:type II secretory ATPase GspE/PulE/Tfp pilus assembly ATPase PilB-like protein
VDEEALIPHGHTPLGLGCITIYRGKGCANCHYTGMKGRSAIYEVLPVTAEIRGLILHGTFSDEIHDVAQKQGMKTLREAGLAKVLEGATTVEEVLRVTTD